MREGTPESTPLETTLIRYWHHQAQYLRSADQAKISLKKWSDFFPNARVSAVTQARQRQFVQYLANEGLSNGYIRRVLAAGQTALNRAVREGELTSAPHVHLGLAAEGNPREREATIEEAAWLFRVASLPHQRMYLLLAFGTVARPEAILELKADQVDVRNRLFALNPEGRTQTKKRRPTIPICDTLLPYVARVATGHLVNRNGRELKGMRTTFTRLTAMAARRIRKEAADAAWADRRRGDREAAHEALADGRRRSEAIKEITPYVIRHTMGGELRRRDVPEWEACGMLGHSSGYKTTERYAKYSPSHLGHAARAIDAYFADLAAVLGGLPAVEDVVPLRRSCVGVIARKVVEPRGVEPLTSTMPL